MFNILHHKSIPTDPIGINRLGKLAIMVDKYDCVRAMHYRANCKILAMKDRKEPYHLLWPAYAFDKAQSFTSLTNFKVLHLPNGEQIINPSESYGLPKDVVSYFAIVFIGEHPIESSSKYIVTANSNSF